MVYQQGILGSWLVPLELELACRDLISFAFAVLFSKGGRKLHPGFGLNRPAAQASLRTQPTVLSQLPSGLRTLSQIVGPSRVPLV